MEQVVKEKDKHAIFEFFILLRHYCTLFLKSCIYASQSQFIYLRREIFIQSATEDVCAPIMERVKITQMLRNVACNSLMMLLFTCCSSQTPVLIWSKMILRLSPSRSTFRSLILTDEEDEWVWVVFFVYYLISDSTRDWNPLFPFIINIINNTATTSTIIIIIIITITDSFNKRSELRRQCKKLVDMKCVASR